MLLLTCSGIKGSLVHGEVSLAKHDCCDMYLSVPQAMAGDAVSVQ